MYELVSELRFKCDAKKAKQTRVNYFSILRLAGETISPEKSFHFVFWSENGYSSNRAVMETAQ